MKCPSLKIGGVTVAQAPNPPLIVAIAAAIVGRLASDGSDLHDGARALFYMALTIWAWEEASRGDGWFRRGLGVAFLAYVVYAVARAFA